MANEKYKILVSQPRPLTDHNRYTDMEEEFGVTFDFHQLIRLDGLDVREFRKQHINPLDYTAVYVPKCVSLFRIRCTSIVCRKR